MDILKKLLTILLILVVAVMQTSVAFADGFSVVVESKSANAGDEVEINISLENNPGIIAALFKMEYDRERLELVSVADKRLLEGGIFSPNYTFYPYTMVWNSASHTNFTDDGTLVTLKFKVLEEAESGNAFINLTYNNDDIFDVDMNNVDITVRNGGVEVNGKANDTAEKPDTDGGNKKPSKKPTSSSGFAPAITKDDGKNKIVLTIGKKDALVFGETRENDVAPKIVNNRTMLPIRFIAEALGAKVEWVGETQTVKVTADGINISLVIGNEFATVNGEKIELDSPSFVENDRTYLPIRFVSEKLGAKVEWEEKTQTVTITK